MSNRTRTVGGLYNTVAEASPATAAVLIAQEAGFERKEALELVYIMQLIDEKERVHRPLFWQSVKAMIGSGK